MTKPRATGGKGPRDAEPTSLGHERALRQLITTTQDGVVFVDGDSRIVLFNPAAEEMFGYGADEVLGEKMTILMGAPYREKHDAYVAHYEATGERRAIGKIRTVIGVRKSGESFPIELSVTEIRGQGRVRYGAFLRDISEKVSLQEQLIERERLAAMGSAAAMLAHEIGNPLNNMYIQAQILRRGFDRDEEANDKYGGELDAVIGEVRRLMRLLEEFRSVSRRSGHRLEPVDLTAVVRRVGKQLEAAAGKCRVSLELPSEQALVEGDADKLHQLVVNLGKNGLEAMSDPGELTLGVEARGDVVELSVADRGCGVPEGMDILEPFKTTKDDGTGLGLAVVSQIVRGHKATIMWERREGGGTVFRVAFPSGDVLRASSRS
ncbi:MAG TPA: PAS domain S-box protein, partial [Polyangiaceae bacterium]|nr:PAS domain S-box protein [Polyangiaceae bacterium]